MSRATLTRLRKLEVKARLDGSIENLTDGQLFSAYRDLIERGGGDDVFSASLQAEGEEQLARSVLDFAACRAAAEFISL
ncbi:hypothetical protein DC522_28335 [Microvirga sp. KLBC 81]|uniref:hypothetical protein n=1 Tax=Microvirga sp. KLBC 81 TaxID=1862707 RepID=UPI000D506B4E|nr:hypothetical protein [Microvirga sp. KLBC 81]PVE21133.1 hypothetical protein DC522_28335 [Microvirga sp. KLBC 81]